MRLPAHGRLANPEPNAIGIGNPPTPSNMYLGVPKQFHTKILAADMEFLALVFHQILVLASEKVPSGCPPTPPSLPARPLPLACGPPPAHPAQLRRPQVQDLVQDLDQILDQNIEIYFKWSIS